MLALMLRSQYSVHPQRQLWGQGKYVPRGIAAQYHGPEFRAALALAEAVTRLSDRLDPVPDEIGEEATWHYDASALAALILSIATVNLWNRLNATTRQVPGEWAH